MTRETRDWAASETSDLVGARHELSVAGMVQTFRTDERARLVEASPQGINLKILILDVIIDHGEAGGEVLGWTAATYRREISARQFQQVTVRCDGAETTVDVNIILS